MAGLAAVIDGLRCGWLPERRWLQHHEVATRFFEYLNVPYPRPSPVRNLGQVAAELCGTAIPSAIQFAAFLRANMGPIEEAFANNAKARTTTTRAWKQGWMEANSQVVSREYVATLLPSRTPAGLEISEGLRREFLKQLNLEQFPSVAVEHAILDENLRTGASLSEQSFLDNQHGITALPYVEAVVSDDLRFTRMVNRVAPQLPFPVGRMITRQTFDREYLDYCE